GIGPRCRLARAADTRRPCGLSEDRDREMVADHQGSGRSGPVAVPITASGLVVRGGLQNKADTGRLYSITSSARASSGAVRPIDNELKFVHLHYGQTMGSGIVCGAVRIPCRVIGSITSAQPLLGRA